MEAGNLRLELELFLLVISCAVFLADESELVITLTWFGDPGVIGVVVGTSEDGLIVLTVVVSIGVDVSVIGE